MSFTDPIADMATRLRNAVAVGKTSVSLPLSQQKKAVAEVLRGNGYLSEVKVDGRTLLLETGQTPISGIKRISKPGRRTYGGRFDLPKVRNGLGIAIVSTSQGVMSADDARRRHLGGEVMLEVF